MLAYIKGKKWNFPQKDFLILVKSFSNKKSDQKETQFKEKEKKNRKIVYEYRHTYIWKGKFTLEIQLKYFPIFFSFRSFFYCHSYLSRNSEYYIRFRSGYEKIVQVRKSLRKENFSNFWRYEKFIKNSRKSHKNAMNFGFPFVFL